MEPNNEYEQEIDLIELMFAVLHKWRPMLVAAVLLAFVLGGYKAVSTYRSQNDSTTVQEAEEKYQEELRTYEKGKETCEREISNLQSDIANQQEYLEKSILMNMSAYGIWEATTELFVKTDYEIMPNMVYQNIDYTGTIVKAYQYMLTNTASMKKIADKIGIETRYLKELVDITVDDKLIRIKVRHDDEKTAMNILNDILEEISKVHPQIEERIGENTITTINQGIAQVVDLDLANKQKSENDRLIQLNSDLETKQTELEDMEAPTKNTPLKKTVIVAGIKFAVVGGVLGACMVAFFVCAFFVMSDKMYSEKELRSRYRIKLLGSLPPAKKSRGIDAWLDRLEGRVFGEEETEYGLIAANVRNYAEKADTLMVMGTAQEAEIDKVAEKLAAQIPDRKVINGGNMLQNADALAKLPEVDAVILVEQCKVSQYSKIGLELEKAKDLQKDVAGCIILN